MGVYKRLYLLKTNRKNFLHIKSYSYYRKDIWGILLWKKMFKYKKAIYNILKIVRKFYYVILQQVYKGIHFTVKKYGYVGNLFFAKRLLRMYYGNLRENFFGRVGRLIKRKSGLLVNHFFSFIERRLDVLFVRSLFTNKVLWARVHIIYLNIYISKIRVSQPSFVVRVGDVISTSVRPKALGLFSYRKEFFSLRDKRALKKYRNFEKKFKLKVYKFFLKYFYVLFIKPLKKKFIFLRGIKFFFQKRVKVKKFRRFGNKKQIKRKKSNLNKYTFQFFLKIIIFFLKKKLLSLKKIEKYIYLNYFFSFLFAFCLFLGNRSIENDLIYFKHLRYVTKYVLGLRIKRSVLNYTPEHGYFLDSASILVQLGLLIISFSSKNSFALFKIRTNKSLKAFLNVRKRRVRRIIKRKLILNYRYRKKIKKVNDIRYTIGNFKLRKYLTKKKYRFSKNLYFFLRKKKKFYISPLPAYLESSFKTYKITLIKEPSTTSIRFPFGIKNNFFFDYYRRRGFF